MILLVRSDGHNLKPQRLQYCVHVASVAQVPETSHARSERFLPPLPQLSGCPLLLLGFTSLHVISPRVEGSGQLRVSGGIDQCIYPTELALAPSPNLHLQ